MFGIHRRARAPRAVDPDLRFLRTSLWASVVVAIVTALGGVASHSVAVLADASEKANDILSSALAVRAEHQGTDRHRRLAALVNAVSLTGISIFMAAEGVARLLSPAQVDTAFMTGTAVTTIAANTLIALRAEAGRRAVRHPFRRIRHPPSAGRQAEGGMADQSVSVRGPLVDAFSDIAVSASVLAAAGLTALTGLPGIDAALSIGIGAWIGGHNALPMLRQSLRGVRELPPHGVDPGAIAAGLTRVPGVLGLEGLRVTGDRASALRLEGRVQIDPAQIDPRDLALDVGRVMGGAATATCLEPAAAGSVRGPALSAPVPRFRARSPRRSLETASTPPASSSAGRGPGGCMSSTPASSTPSATYSNWAGSTVRGSRFRDVRPRHRRREVPALAAGGGRRGPERAHRRPGDDRRLPPYGPHASPAGGGRPAPGTRRRADAGAGPGAPRPGRARARFSLHLGRRTQEVTR
ncbi:MAG TPA: cation diffusion facilitator family transporter [Candidatus Dormibacteraeota bacterium]|jgi:cobalt-zinc-cadmium efflux system protein|nr:cation diffusion facilitator family transporter [Candidatus Dormibacteraeota bacterium]